MAAEATPIMIWTGGDCAGPPGYGYGGWTWLAVQGEAARAAAGGERHTTSSRMVLRAMVEGLKAVAETPAAPVQLYPGDPAQARVGLDIAARRAAAWRTTEGDPIEDADLWEMIANSVAARSAPVRFGAGDLSLGKADPRQFVGAWTRFARDCCKDKGAFSSAVPKPNLQAFMAKR